MGRSLWLKVWTAVGIIGLVLGFFIFPMCIQNNEEPKESVIASVSINDPTQEAQRVKALEQWVYDHSARIPRQICNKIVRESLKSRVPLLMLALITAESEFTPTVVSPKGAIGLTQIMPGVWEKHLISKKIIQERRDLFDISCSIAAGDEVLSICLKDAKGDVTHALERYLGGKDGAYVKKISGNMMNLYYLTESIR